jgi:hypothetical protein
LAVSGFLAVAAKKMAKAHFEAKKETAEAGETPSKAEDGEEDEEDDDDDDEENEDDDKKEPKCCKKDRKKTKTVPLYGKGTKYFVMKGKKLVHARVPKPASGSRKSNKKAAVDEGSQNSQVTPDPVPQKPKNASNSATRSSASFFTASICVLAAALLI